MNDSSLADTLTALGTLGIAGYEISQGAPASTTIGPGGIAFTQTGSIVSQTSLFLVLGVLAAGLLAWYVLARR